ncbi:MAG: hypothetical protein PHO41_12065, partial [Eubacteriales bacterium]|nr:hypothetical protein [Eubacteriales bacterium]
MLNPRLLLVLSGLANGETALGMALEAIAHAARPLELRFAVPLAFADAFLPETLPEGAPKPEEMKWYDEAAGISSLFPLLTDETHFLLLRSEYRFTEHWDRTLYARYAKCRARRALLTAAFAQEGECVQPALPALRGTDGPACFQLGAGMALVNCAAPVQTLLVQPSFVFGRTAFWRDATVDCDTLSLCAYAAGYTVYALDRAPLLPVNPAKTVLVQPPPEAMPPTSLSRFEQLAGFSFTHNTAAVRAMLGIFGVEDAYSQRLPIGALLVQRTRTLLRNPEQPLFVTAFIDLSDAPHPAQSYLLRFSYLRALNALALALYTGGEMERALRAKFPNTLAYPDNALLPRTLLSQGMTPMQLFKRNKLPLLLRAARAWPSYRYFAWVDLDALPHPICPDAAPNCTALMDDRVHIGWVHGYPDTSFMVVPGWLLKPLVA